MKICSWCGKILDKSHKEIKSHGMCKKCAAEKNTEIDRMFPTEKIKLDR